jgi:hypothetical protein
VYCQTHPTSSTIREQKLKEQRTNRGNLFITWRKRTR